jgi:hypothetical protein
MLKNPPALSVLTDYTPGDWAEMPAVGPAAPGQHPASVNPLKGEKKTAVRPQAGSTAVQAPPRGVEPRFSD